MRFSLFMTVDCWGSAANYFTSKWLANAMIRAIKTDIISWDDFHFGTDDLVWKKLEKSKDPYIQKQMKQLFILLIYQSYMQLSTSLNLKKLD